MKIHLSQYAGFCHGVKRAYDMVGALDISEIKKPVYILGSLVHNDDVNRKIEEKGIQKISQEDFFAAKAGEIGTIIITAHGDGPDIFAHAERIGAEVIDTTCPKVIKVQRLAKVYSERGYKIILVGDKGHKEVGGINKWGGGEAVIISNENDLKNMENSTWTLDLDVQVEKIAVLAQTTQNEEFVKKVGDYIQKKYPNAEMIPTTCSTTHERQEEIRKLAGEFEAVVVIGSPESANSKRLYEIAKNINGKTYFIENASQLEGERFGGAKNAAVTAGASTPGWIIEEVMSKLKE